MPFCPDCGTEVSEDTRFCPECGRTLAIEQAVTGKSKKKLAGIIVACIIVAIVIVVIATRPPTLKEPEPAIPTHFATYTDEAGLFSISYPPEWELALELIEEIEQMEEVNVLFIAGLPFLEGFNPNVSILAWPCPSIVCRHDAIVTAEIEGMQATDPGYQELSRVRTTVDGRTATILVSQGTLPGEPTYQYVQMLLLVGRTVWGVCCTTLPDEYSKWEGDFDAIVRSLRILK
jgi:predicted nucleic acid-binding Zn ribbon protein